MPTRPEKCPDCGKDSLYSLEQACRACYYPVSQRSPNVLLAESLKDRLRTRFDQHRGKANSKNKKRLVDALVTVGDRAKAVTATPLSFAEKFLTDPRIFYASYHQQVEAGVRAMAPWEDDVRRRTVDSSIYGTPSKYITMAALSNDGIGPTAWGDIHLELDSMTIKKRATVIESNSYRLARIGLLESTMEHTPEFLAGRISTWEHRGLLVSVKLSEKLVGNESIKTLARRLLVNHSRTTTDLCEVHIYGGFNHQAVRGVRVGKKTFKNPINKFYLKRITDCLSHFGIAVTT